MKQIFAYVPREPKIYQEMVQKRLILDQQSSAQSGQAAQMQQNEQGEPGPNSKKAKMDNPMKKWKCTYNPCTKKRFGTMQELRSHIANAHRERKLPCDRCPAAFVYKYQLLAHGKNHDETESKIMCMLCNAFFSDAYTLYFHIQEFH